jgi:hypothetical protein
MGDHKFQIIDVEVAFQHLIDVNTPIFLMVFILGGGLFLYYHFVDQHFLNDPYSGVQPVLKL